MIKDGPAAAPPVFPDPAAAAACPTDGARRTLSFSIIPEGPRGTPDAPTNDGIKGAL
jgi:hypothetical protein